MTALLLLMALLATAPRAPSTVTIATARGELELPVRADDTGAPVLYASPLVHALGGEVRLAGAWAEVSIARLPLRLLVGASFYVVNNRVQPMAARVSMIRDTLFVPLEFVATVLPREYGERFRWDPIAARLMEAGWKPPPAVAPPEPEPSVLIAAPSRGASGPRLPNGLRPGHLVTVDAGHGGDDPGNPGLFFPRGLKEKHVTLQVALMLREELQRRGVAVRMTRTTDILPNLLRRAPTCGSNCDLFVSLHVDALDPKRRRDYAGVRGYHTLIIGEENTEDADRVANMENEALRFESPEAAREAQGALGFILRDLQMNEFLRESARAGELIQERLSAVHTGRNRGVKQTNRLAVLNTARRPAVLVEMGYSTNRQDAQLLTAPASQRRMAIAIADAVVDYLLEYERRSGETDATGSR